MHALEDYAAVGQILKNLYIKKVILSPSSEDLWEIFKNNPKLVVAMNHGPSSAPYYVGAGMGDVFLKNGGAKRKYIAVIWKYLYKYPGLRKMAQLMTQVEKSGTFEEFLALYASEEVNDFYVMPEGENCMFGNGVDIEEFLSPRFLEVAILSGVPVLLAVHHGTHLLAKPVDVSDRMMKFLKWVPKKNYERIQETGMISLPKGLKRLPSLQFNFKLYHPSLSIAGLSDDKQERKAQLTKEGKHVRGLMQEMVEVLKIEKRNASHPPSNVVDVTEFKKNSRVA